MRKKLLSSPILLLIVLSVFSINITGVSAVDSPYIAIIPKNNTGTPGTVFNVSLYTNYGWNPDWSEFDVTGYQFTLFYNPAVLEILELHQGEIIVSGDATFLAGPIDNTVGELSLTMGFYDFGGGTPQVTSMYRLPYIPPWPGPWIGWNGTLAKVTFNVTGSGASTIKLGSQTKLIGWNYTEGSEYTIIDAETMPTNIDHGFFQNVPTVTRDVAVTSVTSPTSAFTGELVDIEVVVKNEGDVNEDFEVTAYYDSNTIGTETVTNLLPGATKSLTLTWDTASVTTGTYTISVNASTVLGETDIGDNTNVDGTVSVTVPEDPPEAIISARSASDVGEEETFDGTGSFDPDGGEIIAYEWDFGDDSTATGAVVTHVYQTNGTYQVTLVVTDSQYQESDPCYHLITIEEFPPAALVKWKAKAEASLWVESTDNDGNVTLTALAGNRKDFGSVSVSITFAIIDARGGTPIGTVMQENLTLFDPGQWYDVPVSVLMNPHEYDWDGSAKKVFFAEVTLRYYDSVDKLWILASTKIIRFAVVA